SIAQDDSAKFLESRFTILLLVAFLGLILFQSVYVFVQFWISRLPEYLNYFFFLLCLMVYFFVRLDYWYNTGFMMDGIPALAPYLNDVFLLAPFVFYLRFSRFFIGTVTNYPKINNVIKIVEKGVVGLIVLSVVFVSLYKTEWSIWMIRAFTIVFFVFSIFVIWHFYRQHDKLVNSILLGSMFALVGNALAVLLSVFGADIDFDHSLFTMSGIVAEVMMFNIGLSYKAKTTQAEKIKAQNAVIHELDRSRKYQQELEGMRSQIADDLHDDVGSTLSSISVYSELGLQGDENARMSMLKKISDASQRMMSAMNDIVWAIHSKNDSLGDLTDRMRQFATERLIGEDVTFQLENEKMIDNLHLTMRARRNILLMFKEAVHNALKHGKAKNVVCKVKSITNGMSVIIEDNGIGFDPVQMKFGNGIASMRKRAMELGGSCDIQSVPGQGTNIVFIVPINKLTIDT
ncbi:MAG: 7TM diverse intracellular signaling domain-containing protein, partial [Bacteroidota bacterium]